MAINCTPRRTLFLFLFLRMNFIPVFINFVSFFAISYVNAKNNILSFHSRHFNFYCIRSNENIQPWKNMLCFLSFDIDAQRSGLINSTGFIIFTYCDCLMIGHFQFYHNVVIFSFRNSTWIKEESLKCTDALNFSKVLHNFTRIVLWKFLVKCNSAFL